MKKSWINGADALAEVSSLRTSLPYRALESKQIPHTWESPPKSNHTAVRITGGIGDLIVSLPAAQALNKIVEDVHVYSKWPELSARFAPELPAKPESDLEKRGLDWIINMAGQAKFQFADNFEGFKNGAMNEIYIQNQKFIGQNEFEFIVEHHPHLDCIAATKALKLGLDRRSIAFAFLGLPFEWPTPIKTPKYALEKYITVHDGFDNLIDTKGRRATKTWNMHAWADFVAWVKEEAGCNVIQIGGKNSRHIPGVDVDLRGKMTFWDSVAVLSRSSCHVDGDSGLVHAANRIGARSVVIFGSTDPKFFGYPENINIAPKFCGNCWWTTMDWMANCPIGLQAPRCMDSTNPSDVITAVAEVLEIDPNCSECMEHPI